MLTIRIAGCAAPRVVECSETTLNPSDLSMPEHQPQLACVPMAFAASVSRAKAFQLCLICLLLICRQGIVTDEMIAAPDKRLFALNGLLEAMSQLLGLVGASKLPGEPSADVISPIPLVPLLAPLLG